MLPTPTTSHLSFNHIYEPSEDTFLLLDTLTLQSPFLHSRFPQTSSSSSSSSSSSPPPLVLELGSGSGVITSFLTTHSTALFGHNSITTLSTDISPHAPKATRQTVAANLTEESGCFLGAVRMDLAIGLRSGVVDMLVFNPPYVPTEVVEDGDGGEEGWIGVACGGGVDGMEVTNRVLEGLLNECLSERGVAYILLCERNRPEVVAGRLRNGEYDGVKWVVEKVGTSGRKGGWEVLGIWRVMRW
ncbi:hypothetical protein B9Z19DRAFT_1088308 [Tuber borchii]|uniref:Uncharacterized protein n=1 Tax=Tuber borchii TaxID=42251 RepID=A0A2T6ZLY0_TUBBO|nr:hypothetical protein B9Z19DRAFT_1088308 [Tuber borchii]